MAEVRELIINEVQRILLGPMTGANEVLEKNPLDFYSTGILYPQVVKTPTFFDETGDAIPVDLDNEEIESGDEQNSNMLGDERVLTRRVYLSNEESSGSDELELTTKFRPSSLGLSVLVKKGQAINGILSWGWYKKSIVEKETGRDSQKEIKRITQFHRVNCKVNFSLADNKLNLQNLPVSIIGNIQYAELSDNLQICVTNRRYSIDNSINIITLSLINSKTVENFPKQKVAEDCIFHPLIEINCEQGFAFFDDRTNLVGLNEEELNMKLLYRNYKTYALGHGVSVNWIKVNELVQNVFTQVLPQEKVNGMEFNPGVINETKVLYIKRLSGSTLNAKYLWSEIKAELNSFTRLYKNWVENKKSELTINQDGLQSHLISQGNKNLNQCERLYQRMIKGIELLDNDPDVRKAFEDANRAMFMQRVMADFSKHRRVNERVQHNDDSYDDAIPDFKSIPFDSASDKIWENGQLSIDENNYPKGFLAKWRPFQLAFLLSQIEGIIDPTSEDRDTVDLIWFPTGGGKTEAYLGLMAFTVFYRRLFALRNHSNPDKGAGVAVLMRYTLRLLNKQQFERACILICACDLIRRNEPKKYGNNRISNGIWMGSSMTPNREENQIADYRDYINQINRNRQPDSYKTSPPILSCPACGNRLVKERNAGNVFGRWGYKRALNLRGQPTGPYQITCTNTKCDFYEVDNNLRNNTQRTLPIYEVDETIYEKRPSLLFSTVDKFVQLAWKADAFNLFNVEFNNGTMIRLYPAPSLIIQDELHLISSALGTVYAVYEVVIDKLCKESDGQKAKIVGASATVKNAREQCRRLYARNGYLQFPPPGIDADDSFYALKKTDDPNSRLYVGFMPSGVTTSTALIRLTAVLLERLSALDISNKDLDDYYTLVVYFNALKELGKFRTFLSDDIVAYRKLLSRLFKTFEKPYNNNLLCELSSVMTADDITSGLDSLEKITLPFNHDENNPIVKELYQSGIRTFNDLLSAKGDLWKSRFVTEEFFKKNNIDFSDDYDTDYQTFRQRVKGILGNNKPPIQIAPATNMISVGVDIPRLNTMIINGQPKTSSEYIQSSSRVGREKKGVIFSFLAPTKNRDRSHYEQFKAFHQSYYKYVESSSVTPFSIAALEKVIPTVLIALTRSIYLKGQNAPAVLYSAEYQSFLLSIKTEIMERASFSANSDVGEIERILVNIFESFSGKLQKLSGQRRLGEYLDFLTFNNITGLWESRIGVHTAFYNAPSQFVETVLTNHIPTMQTLRNVESNSKVVIKNT